MAYTIFSSNNSAIATIEDGTIDNSTSLTLIGKNFAGFGSLLNENFVFLLENFASEGPPENPIPGQLWYDTGNKVLKLRTTNNSWKSVGGVTASPLPPEGPSIGDQWWHTLNNQLYSWSGNSWDVIGPAYSASQGLTGAIPGTIRDVDGVDHVVIKNYINDIVVGIWSKEDTEFTVSRPARIPGFYENNDNQIVKPGLTLANIGIYDQPGLSNIPKNMIWGTASRALSIGDNTVASFVRRDPTGEVQSVSDTIEFTNETAIIAVGNIEPSDTSMFNIGSEVVTFANVYADRAITDVVQTDYLYSDIVYADSIFLNGQPIASIVPADKVGNLSTLKTTAKANVVSAVNELRDMWVAGMVMMWSGSIANIPVGWALCDGSIIGSYQTPDLRNRFIIGAGATYNPGASGGSADAVVVSHTHTATTAVTVAPHTHDISATPYDPGLPLGGTPLAVSSDTTVQDYPVDGSMAQSGADRAFMNIVVDNTTISANAITTVDTFGTAGTDKNLPPYYALCFIIKLP